MRERSSAKMLPSLDYAPRDSTLPRDRSLLQGLHRHPLIAPLLGVGIVLMPPPHISIFFLSLRFFSGILHSPRMLHTTHPVLKTRSPSRVLINPFQKREGQEN